MCTGLGIKGGGEILAYTASGYAKEVNLKGVDVKGVDLAMLNALSSAYHRWRRRCVTSLIMTDERVHPVLEERMIQTQCQ